MSVLRFFTSLFINLECPECQYQITDSDLRNRKKILENGGVLRCPKCNSDLRTSTSDIPNKIEVDKINSSPRIKTRFTDETMTAQIPWETRATNAILIFGFIFILPVIFSKLSLFQTFANNDEYRIAVVVLFSLALFVFTVQKINSTVLRLSAVSIDVSSIPFGFKRKRSWPVSGIKKFEIEERLNDSRTGSGSNHYYLAIVLNDQSKVRLCETYDISDAIYLRKIFQIKLLAVNSKVNLSQK